MTISEFCTFHVANFFPAAIENFDYSGLDDYEIDELVAFLDALPAGAVFQYEATPEDFGECDILHSFCERSTMTVYILEPTL